ncbi:MAG TPA: serine hydrolase [Rhizomicrobium sp.]
MNRHAPALAALSLSLLLLSCAPKVVAPPPAPAVEYWPTDGWRFSTPEEQGIDSAVLADAIETLRATHVPIHSLLVERNGFVVLDAYFFPFSDGEPHDVASVTKSVLSTLTGIAVGEGRLGDIHQPIGVYFPEMTTIVSDPRTNAITLADLLSMTSGLDCRDLPDSSLLEKMQESSNWAEFMLARPLTAAPGTIFSYCGGSMHLVSSAFSRAIGESALHFANRELFAPLGIGSAVWPSDPQGASHGWGDLELAPRDMAKLGYLWLHNGRWNDRQIVPQGYLQSALSPHVNVQQGIAYGYGMWLYPGHSPYDFEANGRGGQRITVVPDENLVTVMTAGGVDANIVAPLLAKAVRTVSALPPNPQGVAHLAQAVADAARPPTGVPPTALPAWAVELERTYSLPPNPLNLRTFSFDFSTPGLAIARFGFADGRVEQHPVGMDGVPRISAGSGARLPIALAGSWRANAFDLSFDQIARINAFTLQIVPANGGMSARITERTGLADVTLLATPLVP